MKYIMMSCCLVLCSLLNAQVNVNNININNLKSVNYIEVSCDLRLVAARVNVYVDYGQNIILESSKSIIKDEEGNEIKFLSHMQVLNYFDNNGWDLVEKETVVINSNKIRKNFLLKKEE